METEVTKKRSGRKIAFIILISVISAFVIYYSIMSMKSPTQKLEEIKNEFQTKATDKSDLNKRIQKDSAYLKLLREKAFLQSRIVLAETDSIYLSINLADSTANIGIYGIVVHKAKMSEIQISKILMKRDESAILSMFATPLTISRAFATIKKEPVMIQMAPKDTSEYIPDPMPDTTITEPVNYFLETDKGVRIYVYQKENAKIDDRISQFRFDLNYRLKDTWSALKRVSTFKVPDYHPFIKIKLPRTDAKIIYRALPRNGQIAIFS
jgi:hypothetical protein